MQEAWGFDPKDRGRWAILHFDTPVARLDELPAGLAPEGQYQATALKPVGELTIPEPDSLEVERLGLNEQQRTAYWVLAGELEESRDGPIHRVLGWPEQVQHDPAVEVQLPANGIYAGDAVGYQSDEGKRLMAVRDIWQLVIQVDSDDETGMMLGDGGRLYFMMRRDDLRDRRWDPSWFSFQCR